MVFDDSYKHHLFSIFTSLLFSKIVLPQWLFVVFKNKWETENKSLF